LDEFVADIKVHPTDSIDAFLETRASLARTMEIGRHVIAVLIGESIAAAEKARRPVRPAVDWLEYLIRRMSEGARDGEEFAEGNSEVRLITFNFDSVIEQRLLTDLERLYPAKFQVALRAIPVHHVHGHLPNPPNDVLFNRSLGTPSDAWVKWVRQASAMIRVVRDEIEEAEVQHARDAVTRAKILCFLGFSYHVENLKRLGMPETTRDRGQSAYGSAYGFLLGERQRIEQRFPGLHLELGGETDDCLKILRIFHIFRD